MKPFSSGSPTEASTVTKKKVAYLAWGRQSAKLGDLVGMAAFVRECPPA